jgi:uncharacterized protein (DUF2267 family)
MTIPYDYTRASIEFERFMVDARDCAGLHTTNMAWNMVVGVLWVFRRRLSLPQALCFAELLPAVPRAIFVEGWAGELARQSEPLPFGSREALTQEVRGVRHEHNFSPDDAIRAVAKALRLHVDEAALDRVLASLSAAAREYWQA